MTPSPEEVEARLARLRALVALDQLVEGRSKELRELCELARCLHGRAAEVERQAKP